MSKWISVKDRLPREDVLYLAFGNRISRKDSVKHIYFAFFDFSRGHWINADTFDPLYFVTYWRHMIKPPRDPE